MKDYIGELIRLENHISNNPHDYQSKISYMILKSKQIDYEYEQAMSIKNRRIAEIKKRLESEENEKS